MTVAPNGGNAGVSQVTNLTIGAGGKLDLKNNDLIVPTGTLTRAQVETLVNSGALSATWILTTSGTGITGLGTA